MFAVRTIGQKKALHKKRPAHEFNQYIFRRWHFTAKGAETLTLPAQPARMAYFPISRNSFLAL